MKFSKLILHILWALSAVYTAFLMLISVSVSSGCGGWGGCFIMISITDNCYTENHTSATGKPECDTTLADEGQGLNRTHF